MPPRANIPKDEELGKRDDDFRPARSSSSSASSIWRLLASGRKRRLVYVVAALLFVYVFVKNIPTDLGPVRDRVDVRLTPGWTGQTAADTQQEAPTIPGADEGDTGLDEVIKAALPTSPHEPSGPPPRAQGVTQNERRYYNGPLKFYRLSPSLKTITKTMGFRSTNRHILFAAASLKSAANLMPMACDMAKRDRNYVHMAILGRDSLPMNEILEINGVTTEDCAINFHDGRSDYSDYSTEGRAELAVKRAMQHIDDTVHPQAIITDDSKVEEAFFTRGMRAKATDFFKTLIEVPAGKYEEFLWMSRLDAESLSSWFRPRIDILVQAPAGSSGGLIRLFTNLKNAEYAGLRAPRLTVDLPHDVPNRVSELLKWTAWPPTNDPSPIQQTTLALRHRISPSRVGSEEATLRHLESFYPNSDDDHLLILSSRAELSPLYLQYLHFAILEYHYSSESSSEANNLLGISLEMPSTFLNGTAGFVAPSVKDMLEDKYLDSKAYDQESASPFLYEAPPTSASLIFGEKWKSLHDYIGNRLLVSRAGKAHKARKQVSETEPAWLEYLLELMRARGWTMLHPAQSFATTHNELSNIPEEFATDADARKKTAAEVKKDPRSIAARDEAFLTAPTPPTMEDHIEHETTSTLPLHKFLPFDGALPELADLPYLTFEGHIPADLEKIDTAREEYVKTFRRELGGCEGTDATRPRVEYEYRTDDLFCGLPGVSPEFDLEAEASSNAKDSPNAAPGKDKESTSASGIEDVDLESVLEAKLNDGAMD